MKSTSGIILNFDSHHDNVSGKSDVVWFFNVSSKTMNLLQTLCMESQVLIVCSSLIAGEQKHKGNAELYSSKCSRTIVLLLCFLQQ